MVARRPYLEVSEVIVRYGDLVHLEDLVVESPRLDLFFQLHESFYHHLVYAIDCSGSECIFNCLNGGWVTGEVVVDVFDLLWEIVQVLKEFKFEVPL